MLSVIITVHNEGEELRATLRSVLSKTFGAVEIIVVDDASTDGCCDDVKQGRIRVLRNDKRIGVAFSRHQGVQIAQGQVVCFMDAHQRVATGALNRCADVALQRTAIVVPDIRDFQHGASITHGSSFRMCPKRGIFSATWENRVPAKRITQVSSLRAPAYLMSMETYRKVYWIDGLRNWGGSEAAISLKAFFRGIPILHLCGTPTRHKFKEKLLYDATWEDVWRNHALIARVCFDERTWFEHWHPNVFEPHLTPEAAEDLESELVLQQHHEFNRLKTRSDAEFWTKLLRREPSRGIASP